MSWQRIKCAILGHAWVVRFEDRVQGVAAERNCACGARVPAVVWPTGTDKQQTIWSPTGPRAGAHAPAPPSQPGWMTPMTECVRLSVSPGDTVVITSPGLLTREQRHQIAASVPRLLPDGVKVLVLDAGMKLSVVGKSA